MTKKTRFTEKITALSPEEKTQVISFFNQYPNYENRIDWNRKTLNYSDFEKVFALAEKSAKNQKRKAKENPLLLFEKYNCEILYQTEDFLLAVPMDRECAVFFNSYNCGGEGARWCIGDSNHSSHWYDYAKNKNIFVLVYFTERQPVFGKKIIIQYNTENGSFALFFQSNKGLKSQKNINLLFNRFDVLSKTKLRGKIGGFISMYALLFRVIQNEIPIVGNALWRKIKIPEYSINGSVLEKWLDTKAVEAVIPSGITSIGENVFWGCKNLTAINIPDGVNSIGERAFEWCENLTAINIPYSVASIGKDAFCGCKKLTTINIPDGVNSIGENAFWGCENLTAINIPDSVVSIGKEAFYNCEELKSLILPDNATSIGEGAFKYCEILASINIPDGVISIGKETFYGCKKLTTINIPDSVKYIGKEAFYGCKSLKSLNIPNSVVFIGKKAFYGCESLVSVNIPKSTRVAGNAFEKHKISEKILIELLIIYGLCRLLWCRFNVLFLKIRLKIRVIRG